MRLAPHQVPRRTLPGHRQQKRRIGHGRLECASRETREQGQQLDTFHPFPEEEVSFFKTKRNRPGTPISIDRKKAVVLNEKHSEFHYCGMLPPQSRATMCWDISTATSTFTFTNANAQWPPNSRPATAIIFSRLRGRT